VIASAEVLVSGDDDLLAVEPDRAGFEVLTPRLLIDRLG
jgi:predicted nucleic acid-binding protein